MLKIISLLTGRKIIYLQDFQGEIYRTIEKKTPFGKTAYVYWFTKTGQVILNENGTTSGRASYIEKWKYE